MKKLYVVIITLVIIPVAALSQPCLPEGITFMTQSQIDSFQINYPNCTEIEGDVKIGEKYSFNDIINLNGLSVVTSIGGSLSIGYSDPYWGPFGNPFLISISGLSNVTSIGGDLVIFHNDALISLTGLDNLEAGSIGNLLIYDNQYLATCEVQSICDYLVSPNGSVNIFDNASGCNNPPEVANACGITLPCLPFGNYFFYTQAEIDNFAINYPNCTELEGYIKIQGDDITNLNGLSVVTSIGADLIIYDNESLANLAGINGLQTIGGDLDIRNNDALISLKGLDNVISIGELLYIRGNDVLINLTGLANVTSIGADLRISFNNALASLAGLENVASIAGDLIIDGNDSLMSLAGLENIDENSITSVEISFNNSLTICNVESICDYLVSPYGTIEIHDNAPGCNSPEEVEEACSTCLPEGITFTTQAQIDSFQIVYPNCTAIEGNVQIYGDDITNLDGLNDVISIGGRLLIGDYFYDANPLLTSLEGLGNLSVVSGNLYIWENVGLVTLSGLGSLNLIGGTLGIGSNYKLVSLSGLNNLSSVGDNLGIGGFSMDLNPFSEIHCAGNSSLTDISALSNLTSIGGDLAIHCNDSLSNLTGLENLITIGGLHIGFAWDNEFENGTAGNPLLISLTGLEGLTSIEKEVNIQGNLSLEDLTGLNNVNEALIDSLTIRYNHSLSICEAQIICDYLTFPNAIIEIHDNAPGCNSPEEVEEACDTLSIQNLTVNNDFTVYPNPASNELFISNVTGATITEVTIYNQVGQKVLHLIPVTKPIGISMLRPGMYVVEVIIGNRRLRGKFIK